MEKLFRYNQKEVRTFEKNGEIWFVARDVCDILDLGSASQAVNGRADRPGSGLDDDEKGSDIVTTPYGELEMLTINEAGLYTLIIRSNKPEAKKFKRWITHDVLPQIRTTGQYIPPQKGILPVQAHTQREVQVEMSKRVNGRNYHRGGKRAIIKHNIKSCLVHTGQTPRAVKEEGKRRKLPSRLRQSAKEVLRAIKPEKACCMSMADNLIEQGHFDDKVFAVTTKAESVFKGLLALGVTPAELAA